ncbi:MAG: putative amidohydrolase [Ilumatobacter sp.]|jgi:predicted amidohydrolase
MTTLRIAAIQHDIAWFDRDTNYAVLAPRIAAAAAGGAGLVLLTETFATGFSFSDPAIIEPEGGPSSQFLVAQAAAHGIWVGGSCAELAPDGPADDQRVSNVFVLAGPDGTVHRYRKIHPFSHGGEDAYVRPGTDFVTIEIEGVRVSLFVCYDLRFANEFWALAADTDAYLLVANWPAKRRHHWQTLARARAIENQAYFVAVNRVGRDGAVDAAGKRTGLLDHCGDSMVVDPLGEVLVHAAGAETTIFADIDTDYVASTRAHFKFLQDRR